ncbi:MULTISPECIES: 2Fe-2S iron-sulfur cluster-binding protein [Paracoccus]|uniref:2Fe-2S iron-sulfur cluster-binding protein n=1 Tax=Paracoccus TaxID=265 RepID=UPI0009F3C5E1|nr:MULTISPECIES: 2Fe-2S iron-sulfur cluster-binding protein [Paracoccus]MDF3855660.1 2Fe-2S iron-sulfur cluster-binding protein [Paracoccus pantotrophus]UFS67311.1 2Fe-2S iron-sulfur cluster-binding protein [Paracoccus denitrificans]
MIVGRSDELLRLKRPQRFPGPRRGCCADRNAAQPSPRSRRHGRPAAGYVPRRSGRLRADTARRADLDKEQDRPDAHFRRSRRKGVCGSCVMTIDATNWTACTWAIADRAKPATIFPLANLPAIKELVPDQTHLLAQYEMIEPWLNPGRAIAEIKKKMIERQG